MIGGGVAAAAGGMALGYSVVDEANTANGDNSIVAEFGGAVFMYAAAIAGTGLSAWGAAELHRGRVSRCDGLPGLSGPPGSEPDDIPEREPPDDE